MKIGRLLKMNLQFFAEPEPKEPEPKTPEKDPEPDGDGDKFTQDQLDKILDKRLKRERQKWQQELEEQKKKDQMTAEERAKAEKAEAETKAKQAQERANNKIREVEAKAQALELGVDPTKIKYLLKLADVNDIEVDDDGNADIEAIQKSLKAVLNDMPEFKGNTNARGGQEFGEGNGKKGRAENLSDALKNYYKK